MANGIVVAIVIAFHFPKSLAIVAAFAFVPRTTTSTVEGSAGGNGASVGILHKEVDLMSCNVFFLHMATILSMDFLAAVVASADNEFVVAGIAFVAVGAADHFG